MANNVNITIDADAKKAEDKLKQFQANVRKAGLALSAMGAAGAFAIKGFTAAAIKQDQAMALFLNSARNAGTEMVGLEQKIGGVTAALQNKTNFGDEEQLAVLAKMIPVLGSTEKAMAALPAIMDAAATTGRGLKEQSETLTKALAGTVHQAESLGIKFDKTATFEERLALITKLTGGAAEAAADPFTQLGNATGDLAEKIGEALLPVVVPLVDKIKEFAVRLQTVNPVIIQWGAGILAAATAIGLLGGPLLLIISALPKLILGLKGVTLAFKALTLVMMRNPIIMILTAVVAAVALFAVAWQKNMGGIREFTRDVFVNIGKFIQGGVNTAIKGVNAMIRTFNKIPFLGDIKELDEMSVDFGKAFDGAVGAVDDFAGDVVGKLKGLGDDITDFIIPPPELLGAGFHSMTEGFDTVGDSVKDLGEKTDETFKNMGKSAQNAAQKIAEAFADPQSKVSGLGGTSAGPGASFFGSGGPGYTRAEGLIEKVAAENARLAAERKQASLMGEGMTAFAAGGFMGGSTPETLAGAGERIVNNVTISMGMSSFEMFDQEEKIDDLANAIGNALGNNAIANEGTRSN